MSGIQSMLDGYLYAGWMMGNQNGKMKFGGMALTLRARLT